MNNKGRLLAPNKTLAVFVDLSILCAAYLSQGWLTFAGRPKNLSLQDQILLWYPTIIALLLEVILFKTKKKTIGGLHVANMKLSWTKAVLLIPLNSIVIIFLGPWVIAILSICVMSIIFLIGKYLGLVNH